MDGQSFFEWSKRAVAIGRHAEVEPEIALRKIRAGLQTALQNAHAVHPEAKLVEPGRTQNFRIADGEMLRAVIRIRERHARDGIVDKGGVDDDVVGENPVVVAKAMIGASHVLVAVKHLIVQARQVQGAAALPRLSVLVGERNKAAFRETGCPS